MKVYALVMQSEMEYEEITTNEVEGLFTTKDKAIAAMRNIIDGFDAVIPDDRPYKNKVCFMGESYLPTASVVESDFEITYYDFAIIEVEVE